jgi:25S rRNA (adenine2142-N1)-methyltransferase
MDLERFNSILQTLGWFTVAQHDSALLTHWLLREGEGNLQKWPRKQVRGGAERNNFVVIVK